jgi:hypothetical protein
MATFTERDLIEKRTNGKIKTVFSDQLPSNKALITGEADEKIFFENLKTLLNLSDKAFITGEPENHEANIAIIKYLNSH